MAVSVTQKDLFSTFKEVEKSIQLGDEGQAEMRAKQLHLESLEFVRDSQNVSYIPFLLTEKTVKTLTSSGIQFCDGLKKELSRTAALMSEHVYNVCKSQGRSIYPESRAHFVSKLSILLLTLPKQEITTSFSIKCCRAAIHALDPGEGKWLELGKKHGKDAIVGVLSGGASMSAGPLVAPAVDTGYAIYKEKTDRSYRSLLEMKKSLLLIDTLEKLNVKSIQTELQKYNQKPKYAICLAEVFEHIMLNPQADPKLKDTIFSSLKQEHPDEAYFLSLFKNENQGPNLCSIVSLNDGKKGYWKGRLCGIEILINLSKEGSYQNQSIAILAFRLAVEREKIPANHLWHTYKHESPQQQKIWKQYLAHIKRDEIKKKDKALKNALRIEVQGVKHKLEENTTQQKELQAELSKLMEQAGGALSVGTVNRTPALIREKISELEKSKQNLEQQKADQESWVRAINRIQDERLALIEELSHGK